MATSESLFNALQQLGAGEFAHLNGPLIKHLRGTADLLRAWGNREALCNAGLYHAVYGTHGYDQSLVGLTMREHIAGLIGREAEQIAYLYGACERDIFYPRIGTPVQLSYSDRFTGSTFEITPASLRDLCELIVANELEIAKHSKPFRDQYGEELKELFTRMHGLVTDQALETVQQVFG